MCFIISCPNVEGYTLEENAARMRGVACRIISHVLGLEGHREGRMKPPVMHEGRINLDFILDGVEDHHGAVIIELGDHSQDEAFMQAINGSLTNAVGIMASGLFPEGAKVGIRRTGSLIENKVLGPLTVACATFKLPEPEAMAQEANSMFMNMLADITKAKGTIH